MEDAIERKVWEYQVKINDCDSILGELSSKKGYLRRKIKKAGGNHVGELAELTGIQKDEIGVESRRQAYVQAKYDFDSLFDEI